MESKIRVHAVAQNRTALGIANAYLKLFPNSTLEDLNRAFPVELNSSKRSETIFVNVNDAHKFKNADGESNFETYFLEKDDEVLKLANGQKVAMLETWIKDDFEKIIEHAKQYGIEVASFTEAKPFEKGSFWLEYVNNYGFVNGKVQKLAAKPAEEPVKKTTAAAEPKEKKCCCCWLLGLLALLILLGVIFCALRGCDSCKQPKNDIAMQLTNNAQSSISLLQNGEYVKSYPVLFVGQTAEIDANSNKSLDLLADLMKKDPNARLVIIGNYASKNGKDFDLKLSKERAFAIKNYLIGKGVNEAQIIAVGRGNTDPIGNIDSLNCRTEIRYVMLDTMYSKEIAAANEKLSKGEAIASYPIHYDQGSAALDPMSYIALDGLAKYMNENPDVKLEVIGHASPEGDLELNKQLSLKRAQSVADYLVFEKGIAAERLVVEGKGIEEADKFEDKTLNRRTEIKVIKPEKK